MILKLLSLILILGVIAPDHQYVDVATDIECNGGFVIECKVRVFCAHWYGSYQVTAWLDLPSNVNLNVSVSKGVLSPAHKWTIGALSTTEVVTATITIGRRRNVRPLNVISFAQSTRTDDEEETNWSNNTYTMTLNLRHYYLPYGATQ